MAIFSYWKAGGNPDPITIEVFAGPGAPVGTLILPPNIAPQVGDPIRHGVQFGPVIIDHFIINGVIYSRPGSEPTDTEVGAIWIKSGPEDVIVFMDKSIV